MKEQTKKNNIEHLQKELHIKDTINLFTAKLYLFNKVEFFFIPLRNTGLLTKWDY